MKRAITFAILISIIALILSIFSSLAQDVDPPNIDMVTEFPILIYEGMEVIVQANVYDSSGVRNVTIAYEEDGVSYVKDMVKESLYGYEWTYHSHDIGSRPELIVTILNITALDIHSNQRVVTYDNMIITVRKEDVEGPEIDLEAMSLYTESEDHMIIRASITDPSGVAGVTLHYETVGTWYQKEMVLNNATEFYEAIIGPFETDTAVRYYVNATDLSPNQNGASTLENENGDMRSFIASFRKRYDGSVVDSNYLQVAELHRYRITTSRDTIVYEEYVFNLELSETGVLTGNVSLNNSGSWIHIQDISLQEKNNVIIIDQVTKDGIVYDFNLKYISYNPEETYAEIEINPRQKLVFEGYSIYTSIEKEGGTTTFEDNEGGKWEVSVTVQSGYDSLTRTLTSRNQFQELFVDGKRDIQIFYLGEELVPGDILKYKARIRVYKFQPPIFNVISNVPTGSPSGLAEDQIVYNVYAKDSRTQVVIAQNLAGSRAYDIGLTYTNVTGHSFLVIYEGELTSSLGPVYTEKQVGNETVRYYLTYGTLTRSFDLNFFSEIEVRESSTFDILLTYKDAHEDSHQIRLPVLFLIYPSRSELSVTKSLERDPLFIGRHSQASIVIENTGGSPAMDVTVIDNTPPNLMSDFEIKRELVIKPGFTNKLSLKYSIKPTTITAPGLTSYGFVTVYWKGVCHKTGVRNDAHTIHTEDFYFTALGPHLDFTSFQTDREIVEQGGQQIIFINVGEKISITATVKNNGNKLAKNLSLSFPGFFVESTTFPMGTLVDVGQSFSFTATVVAVNEGSYPFQAKITHNDEIPSLGNVYESYSNYIIAQAFKSPIVVQFIDPPDEISAGETTPITLSIRNIGYSPVENARVLLSLTNGLKLEYGTYLLWDGTLSGLQSELISIEVSGKDFGPNTITATASGKDIPDIDYELHIEVLSPHIEIERTIDCEYLLSREDYWPRSSEIISKVTLTLRNIGNDDAIRVTVSETLPTGLISFDNLTFGSNLIVWGEAGEITLMPNESLKLEYPIWSHDAGHYIYDEAVASYTNPKLNSYESKSNTMEVWVLSDRPLLVAEGPVTLLDQNDEPLGSAISYNDTITFVLQVRNIGNQKAINLDIGEWVTQSVSDIGCVILNTNNVKNILAGGVKPASVLEIPITISVLEDTAFTTSYEINFPLTYSDEVGRVYTNVFHSEIAVRPTEVGLSFTKSFKRERIAPGEEPELNIQVTNVGDTDLRNLKAFIDLPSGISINQSSIVGILRESQTDTIIVRFNPVYLPEGHVYQSYQGFAARVEYESFRENATTPGDGGFLEISVAKPFIDVRRFITSTVMLARNDEWPFSSMIMENVTLTLTNTADVRAESINIIENIPEGLYIPEALGTDKIIWGGDGKLNLEGGQSISFTYPLWSYSEGSQFFEPTAVSYLDVQKHKFGSYSTGIDEVITIMSRPYLVWEGEIVQEPAGSLTYNDTVVLRLTARNVGNSKSSGLTLTGWTTGNVPDGWEVTNLDELNQTLATNLLAGSEGEYTIQLRVMQDVTIPQNFYLNFLLVYSDDSSHIYSISRGVDLFIRPVTISISSSIYNQQYMLMPGETGFLNLTLSNLGDTDLTNITIGVECPEGVSVARADSIQLLGEGEFVNISIVFNGIELGDAVGKFYDNIHLSVFFTDFRGDICERTIGTINLTLKRPMLTLSQMDIKSKTRLGGKYKIVLLIANHGTFPAGNVRIQLGDLTSWVGEITVEGGTLQGNEVILDQEIASLAELEVFITGKVQEKGEFMVTPRVSYTDGIGNEYELVPEAIPVKSGEKIIKMILPFLIWAAVGAGIAGVYYYETRIAEKIKGHQLGSLANSIITHVDATQVIPPLIPFKKKKLSLAEFSYLLSLYLARVKTTDVKKADKTTFIISHPQSRLVPGQDFKNLVVVRDAYMLLAEMIQNRVKTSQIVPPTFLVQGFKVGISDVVYLLSMAVARIRTDGRLARSVRIPCSTKISAGEVSKAVKTESGSDEESGALIEEPMSKDASTSETSTREAVSDALKEVAAANEKRSSSQGED